MNAMVGEMDQKQEILSQNRELYRIIADFTSELALLKKPRRLHPLHLLQLPHPDRYRDREFLETPQLLENIIHPEDRGLFAAIRRLRQRGQSRIPLELRLITRGRRCSGSTTAAVR